MQTHRENAKQEERAMRGYYYSTRRGWHGWTDVVLCSVHTGDVKEVISSHRNAHNARQRAAKLNRARY